MKQAFLFLFTFCIALLSSCAFMHVAPPSSQSSIPAPTNSLGASAEQDTPLSQQTIDVDYSANDEHWYISEIEYYTDVQVVSGTIYSVPNWEFRLQILSADSNIESSTKFWLLGDRDSFPVDFQASFPYQDDVAYTTFLIKDLSTNPADIYRGEILLQKE